MQVAPANRSVMAVRKLLRSGMSTGMSARRDRSLAGSDVLAATIYTIRESARQTLYG